MGKSFREKKNAAAVCVYAVLTHHKKLRKIIYIYRALGFSPINQSFEGREGKGKEGGEGIERDQRPCFEEFCQFMYRGQ